jgi:hypothetical protein
VNRLVAFLNTDGNPSNLTPNDLGTDADNVWTDAASAERGIRIYL